MPSFGIAVGAEEGWRPGFPPVVVSRPDLDATAVEPDDEIGVAFLRDLLAARGYSGGTLAARLGIEPGRQPGRADLPLYRLRLSERSPLDVLIDLFTLGEPVTEREAETACTSAGWRRLLQLGALVETGNGIVATCAISGHGDLLLAHDRMDPRVLDERPDYVLGVNPPALLLGDLTPRRKVSSALDLGTGCGLQALRMARHADRVVGTDIVPRALRYARFNARLNGIANVEFRQGDLFGPVRDERFDLIVANPPYVISPDRGHVYRDSGLPGDSICARIVGQGGRHLREGGLMVTLVNWACGSASPAPPLDAPPRDWVRGTGCDAWILRHEPTTALDYAVSWNRHPDVARYAAGLQRWMDYFRAEGIQSIVMGAVVLRRRTAEAHWVASERVPHAGVGPSEGQINRLVRNMDFLETHPDEASMLAARLRPTDDHEVIRTLAHGASGYTAIRSRIRQRSVCRFEGLLDDVGIRLLHLLDGRRTLGDAVEALVRDGGLEPAACARTAVLLTRRLLTLGFLEPIETGNGSELRSPDGDAGAPAPQ